MDANDNDPLKKLLDKLARERDQAEEEADAPRDGTTDEPPSAEDEAMAQRLLWIVRAAQAHSEGAMPWRAHAPTPQDAEWVTQVCYAVRDKRARPTHPDPDIEQFLLNAFPT